MQKKCSLLEEELKSRANLLEKTCKMLQSCYLQLRGHGFATDLMCEEYQSLVNHLQGRKNITWDSPIDSGLSSTSSVSSTDVEVRPPKRKLNDENINGLNHTFVMEPPKPKVKVCAEELMAKVYKTPNAIRKKRELCHAIKDKRARAVSATRVNAAVEKKTLSKPDVIKKRPFRT
jgi:hypothetical protein